MAAPPFMSRAWAFLFSNVYAHDVHKRRLTLRIIRVRHLRPPLPQERATGSPYPSRRTITRTGSVASLLEARPPTGPHFVYGNLTSESHPIAEAHLPRSTEPHVHLVHIGSVRLADGPPSAGMVLTAAFHGTSCTSSRPKARTAHCAIARLVSAPPSSWDGFGSARLVSAPPSGWGGCGCRLPAVSGRMEAIAE